MRTAILDGDTLLFAAAASSQTAIEWEPGQWTFTGNMDRAIDHLESEVAAIKRELRADEIRFVISDKARFRAAVMPDYKLNRKGSVKPVHYGALEAHARNEMDAFSWPSLEGDDVLGILGTHPTLIPGTKFLVAIDKDLKQIPGKLYNYRTGEKATITHEQADYFFYLQILTGDAVDGYKGCPGVGPKRAAQILDPLFAAEDAHSLHFVWPAIVAAYEKAGCTEEDALMNARVARICRHGDYNLETKEVVLWTP